MSSVPGIVCSLLVFSALRTHTHTKIQNKVFKRSYDPSLTYFTGKSQALSYLLYSVTSLIRSSMEILLLSCLKSGEKRDSLSSAPWLSLNTDLEPFERVWNMYLILILKPLDKWATNHLALTWQTRQTACGTFPVYCKTACWVSTTFEQSVVDRKGADRQKDMLARRHRWYF